MTRGNLVVSTPSPSIQVPIVNRYGSQIVYCSPMTHGPFKSLRSISATRTLRQLLIIDRVAAQFGQFLGSVGDDQLPGSPRQMQERAIALDLGRVETLFDGRRVTAGASRDRKFAGLFTGGSSHERTRL